jgi:hypothetical protein
MKSVICASLIASAAAFAPASSVGMSMFPGLGVGFLCGPAAGSEKEDFERFEESEKTRIRFNVVLLCYIEDYAAIGKKGASIWRYE